MAQKPLGFEDALWKAADKLRGWMDASDYKHVVLGLVFRGLCSERERLARAVLGRVAAAAMG